MRVRTFSVLFIAVAIAFIMTVAAEVFVDDFVKPQSAFAYLLVGTLLTTAASLATNENIPT